MNTSTKRLALPMLPPLFVFVALFASGCGDDEVVPESPDASGPGVDAGADLDAAPTSMALVLGADFTNGVGIATTIEIPSLTVTTNVVAGVVSPDAIVRDFGDIVVIVNRLGFDNVTVLNKAGFTLVEQVTTGAGSNPQDVARANGNLYVATTNGAGVSVIDESDLAGGVVSTIDLSANDPDGNPDCASVVSVGNRLFVSCQLLDGTFQPRGPGIVAVIDPSNNTVVDTLTLTFGNPFSFLQPTDSAGPFGGDILIATVPSFGDYTNGCIERISTGATPAVGSCLVANATLSGYVSSLAEVDGSLATTVTTCNGGDCFGTPPTSQILTVAGDGTPSGAGWLPADSVPSSVASCPTGQALVADNNFAATPGIRVYDSAGVEITSAPLDIGLPPAFFNGIICF